MKVFVLLIFLFLLFRINPFIVAPNQKNGLLSKEVIKIGLLVQDKSAVEAVQAAELAVKEANMAGGIDGHPVKLVVRTMEGPWGTGSKQAVDMIFSEKVWAIIGSHDGRNAHLVEQVATKSRQVFVSAWSADPTLSQAFVPWFFNCIPTDRQQAQAFVAEIYQKRKLNKILLVQDETYDSKKAAENFIKTVKNNNKQEPYIISLKHPLPGKDSLMEQIAVKNIEAIILLLEPSSAVQIIKRIIKSNQKQVVFCNLSTMGENGIQISGIQSVNEFVVVDVSGSGSAQFNNFQANFVKTYNKKPGAVALYAYDAVKLVMGAIKKSKLNRDQLRDALSEMNYEGITGNIRFDEKGNRIGNPGLVEIKKGRSVLLH